MLFSCSDNRRSLLGFDAPTRGPSFDYPDQMLLERKNDEDMDEIRQRVTSIKHVSPKIQTK